MNHPQHPQVPRHPHGAASSRRTVLTAGAVLAAGTGLGLGTGVAGPLAPAAHTRPTCTWQPVTGLAGGDTFLVRGGRTRGRRPVVVYHHGWAGTARMLRDDARCDRQREVIEGLARAGYLVVVGDLGGSLWGNRRNHRLITEAADVGQQEGGTRGPVGLVGTSMGAAAVLSYAVRRRGHVGAVVGLLPAVDLKTLRWVGQGSLDRAYGGRYRDGQDGPRHNPVVIAREPQPGKRDRSGRTGGFSGLPVQLWYGDADTVTTPETVGTFVKRVRTRQDGRVDLRRLRGGHEEDTIARMRPRLMVQHLDRHLR